MTLPLHLDSVPLAVVTRAGVQDNLYRGSVAVVDDGGAVVTSLGDPRMPAYLRSSAKVIQAVPVLTSGAADAFGFDDADVAIIAGSHRGGDDQVAQVRSILDKAGLDPSDLKCGDGLADNCSGKHAGMLAACRHQGYPVESYLRREHPHQQAIEKLVRQVCGLSDERFVVGIDGCGTPIHFFAIRNMALGFARMSVPENHFDVPVARALARITRAMADHPGGHTGEPDYKGQLGQVRLLTKLGAQGVYCGSVLGRGLGYAMKVECGSKEPMLPVFTTVLHRLGVIDDAEFEKLREAIWPKVTNRRGEVVGRIEVLLDE